jgi:hypothetical protein
MPPPVEEALVVLLVVAEAINYLMVCEASRALAFLKTLISSDSVGFVGVILLLRGSYFMA